MTHACPLPAQLRAEHAAEVGRLREEHEAEAAVLRRAAQEPLTEDESIVDLVTRVQLRHEAHDDAELRFMQRLATHQATAPSPHSSPGGSGLQVCT